MLTYLISAKNKNSIYKKMKKKKITVKYRTRFIYPLLK